MAPGISPTRSFRSLLYKGNPFYLLSVLFVIHGTSGWLEGSSESQNPLLLVGLSSAYIALMAVTAYGIVRLGEVWDDARTILLIIVGMFVGLSLTSDELLVRDFSGGAAVLLACYLFAVAVTELLLLGLRIRLPPFYRVPFHAQLAVLMLYPMLLVRAPDHEPWIDVSWGMFLFFPAIGLLLLSLLPAVRRGVSYVVDSGTPWRWPWFPWSPFVFLVSGLCLRGYVNCLSFDPVLSLELTEAMQLKSAFGFYFLIPVVIAVAVVVLEIGLVSRNGTVQSVGLGIPIVGSALIFLFERASVPYTDFLVEFVDRIASPLFVASVALSIFYLVGLLRRVRFSEQLLVASLAFVSIVKVKIVGLEGVGTASPIPLLVLSAFQLCLGISSGSSARCLTGAVAGIVVLELVGWDPWSSFWGAIGFAHPIVMTALAIGMLFDDKFARLLRPLAGVLFCILCVWLVADPFRDGAMVPVYVMAVIALCFVCAYLRRNLALLGSGVVSAAAMALSLLWQGYLELRVIPEWRSIRSFGFAFGLLGLGVVVSALKAGVVGWLSGLAGRFVAEGSPNETH